MKKIRNRLTLTFTLLIGISLLSLGFFLTNLIDKIYLNALGDRLVKEANLTKDMISWEIGSKEGLVLFQQLANNTSKELNTRITFIDKNGLVLADSKYDKNKMDNHANRPEVQTSLNGKIGKAIRYSHTLGMEMLYTSVPIMKNNQIIGVVRLSLPVNEIKASLESFWYSLVIGLFIVFLITILISYRISNKITKPIEDMTEIAKRITNKDYSARIHLNSNDEIGQLGIAINLMADSLNNQIMTIHENEKKITTVLNNMANGVLLVDKSGKIILANPAIEWLLGEQIEQIIGKYHIEAGQNYALSELIERSLNTGESIHAEISIQYPIKKYLDCHLAPIYDAKGQINGVVSVLHDITKLKHLENMRTEFIANVSHELRTPITAVKGFAETLLDGALKDEETSRAFLQIIYNESERLHRLISDLLDLSKIELNQNLLNYSTVDLRELIHSTIETFKPQAVKKQLYIVKELDDIHAEVDGDRIRQVIINLLTNAMAYTPANGSIKVTLKAFKPEQIKITVEDTGIGIPKKSLSRIFERFYRVDKARSRESGGTGLGLAIVKHIVESHEGYIQVESEVQKGTKFAIILPKYKKEKIDGNGI
ncbi:two-component system histidine kinase PnpS [Tepidibacillus sp. HK-1]|uniref:two-component system histidine kinase PnpS n=1 Tax=Tepidibacillus sp. HK-1 TaxID=1883407 RepID=UPI0008533DF4|nr:HAMP domain-containing histidine kinase [Tepidibacillus sp. HK-1]